MLKFHYPIGSKNIMISATLIASLTVSMANAIPAYADTIHNPTSVVTVMSTQQTQSQYDLNRLAGNSRYDTAVAIAHDGWTQSDYAILAFGENYPDALASAPLSMKYNAPILLTGSSQLTDVTRQALLDLKVKHVFIIGGSGVISADVENQVRAVVPDVQRIAGNSRYDTSVEVSRKLGSVDTVFVATGDGYADALSVGPIAGKMGVPILLVQKDAIPDSVQAYLNSHNISKTYVVGGTGVVSDTVFNRLPNAERLSGNSRFDTNIAVLNKFSSMMSQSGVAMATGNGFADALTGASYAAKHSLPVVLIPDENASSQTTQDYLTAKLPNLNNKVVFGGEAVVPSTRVNSYLTGTAVTKQVLASEDELASRLKTAANFVKTLYGSNTVTAMSLNQLATRLIEIENRLNASDLDYGSNLVTAIQNTDTIVSGIDLNKEGLIVSGDASGSYTKTVAVLDSVKGKVGLPVTDRTSNTGSQTNTGSQQSGAKVIYAAPINDYGQQLSLTPNTGYAKITVQFGYHTYGANNQQQYDAIMQKAKEAKAYADKNIDSDANWQAILRYKNGTASETDIRIVTRGYAGAKDASLAELRKLVTGNIMVGYLSRVNPNNSGVGESAYDVMFGTGGDCNGIANIKTLAFDYLGYNTRVLAGQDHAWAEVQSDGTWLDTDAGLKVSGANTSLINGVTIWTPATNSGQY